MYDNTVISSILILLGFYFVTLVVMKFLWKTTIDDSMQKINQSIINELHNWFKTPSFPVNQYDCFPVPLKTRYEGSMELDKAAINVIFEFLNRYFNSSNFVRYADNNAGIVRMEFEIGYTHIADKNSLRNIIRIETIKAYQEQIEEFIADDSVYVLFIENRMRIDIAYNAIGRKSIRSRLLHEEWILDNRQTNRDIEE